MTWPSDERMEELRRANEQAAVEQEADRILKDAEED